MQNFLQAVSFLTRLPVAKWTADIPPREAASLPWYPTVGALLAAILTLVSWLLPTDLNAAAAAIVLLILWTWLTGALHLDGLADSFDAMMGGHANPDRTLEIMKDPRSGAMGVVALILGLLAKFALLLSLWPQVAPALFCALTLARANVLFLFFYTKYVRVGGIAESIGDKLGLRELTLSIAGTLIMLAWLPKTALLLAILIAGTIFLWWRAHWQRFIGGFTGDVAGALIEITEICVLLGFVLWQS